MDLKLVILGFCAVAAALIFLQTAGLLDLFAAVRGILDERKAERLTAQARRDLGRD